MKLIRSVPLFSHMQRASFIMTWLKSDYQDTVMTISFWTDRSGQTLQAKIRLLLEEQSEQGLHCLLFHLNLASFCLNFR